MRIYTYISCSNDLAVSVPNEAQERQQLRADTDDCIRWLFRSAWIYDCDTTVMSSKCKSVATGGEGAAMYPPGGVVQIFSTNGIEGQPFPPDTALRPFIDPFDEAGKHPGMCVGRSSC